MRNPLSSEEKEAIMARMSHDIKAPLGNLLYMFKSLATDPDTFEFYRTWGLSKVVSTLNSIAATESLTAQKVDLSLVARQDLEQRLIENKNGLEETFKKRNDHIVNKVSPYLTPFYSNLDALGLLACTVTGNSAFQVPHGDSEIIVTVRPYDTGQEGEPSDLLYRNPITPLQGKFILMEFADLGPGFAIGETFKFSNRHWGLELAKIISNFLMGHFSIKPRINDSERGARTRLYHPADLPAMYALSQELTGDAHESNSAINQAGLYKQNSLPYVL